METGLPPCLTKKTSFLTKTDLEIIFFSKNGPKNTHLPAGPTRQRVASPWRTAPAGGVTVADCSCPPHSTVSHHPPGRPGLSPPSPEHLPGACPSRPQGGLLLHRDGWVFQLCPTTRLGDQACPPPVTRGMSQPTQLPILGDCVYIYNQ